MEYKLILGGQTHDYLKSHRDLNIRYFLKTHINSLCCPSCQDPIDAGNHHICNHNTKVLMEYGLDGVQIFLVQSGLRDIELFLSGTFIHYKSGMNWNNKSKDFHLIKSRMFSEYFKDIL